MEKKIDSKLIYDGRLLKVFKDDVLCENGNKSIREVVRHPGGVCILGFLNNEVIIEKQFRYPYGKEIIELPAGKLEKGEIPIDAAKREYEEETGYKVDKLVDYGCIYPSVGYTDEIIYLFVAQGLSKTNRNLDEDEQIDIVTMPIEEIVKKIDNNEINDAKTICLIEKYLRRKHEN